MRSKNVPESGLKLKLLEAAEKLFAEYGFEIVSVRDITQAVKANVAAVNYHFGSREELVNLVLSRYLTPINEERLARLEALERRDGGSLAGVSEVVEALVWPVVERMAESKMSEMLYCRLVGRAFGAMAGLPPEIESQSREILGRTRRLLARALPGMSDEDLVWRIHFMVGGMLHLLTHREDLVRLAEGAAGRPDLETTVGRLVRFAVAGLGAGEAAAVVTMESPVSSSSGGEPVLATVVVGQGPAGAASPELEPEAVVAEPEAVVAEPEAVVAEPSGPEVGDDGAATDAKPAKKRVRKAPDEGPQGFFSF